MGLLHPLKETLIQRTIFYADELPAHFFGREDFRPRSKDHSFFMLLPQEAEIFHPDAVPGP